MGAATVVSVKVVEVAVAGNAVEAGSFFSPKEKVLELKEKGAVAVMAAEVVVPEAENGAEVKLNNELGPDIVVTVVAAGYGFT